MNVKPINAQLITGVKLKNQQKNAIQNLQTIVVAAKNERRIVKYRKAAWIIIPL